MKAVEILDYLKTFYEEDEVQFLIEVESLRHQIKIGELTPYYYKGGYSDLIKAIAEILRVEISTLI